jgi:hypothetical protein
MTAVNVAKKANMLEENSPYTVLDVHSGAPICLAYLQLRTEPSAYRLFKIEGVKSSSIELRSVLDVVGQTRH